ncbi:Glycosyltransferase involved in cell wall bisynthesis [Desulfonatronum thiosulfatophilum]|uniref:Glycosyltransferase involved in cell wall bisynthesis n=2 Tax=Desulfonatronum thiosulfatophilum TaxID=617002 RepID=A0A1G6DSN5_9BACT|nr:Glycosyltransferase involved in cell wall bisynthesis [Desulfonatronum thiosulfatophilum]
MPYISIVIPLYNAQSHISRFVNCLQRQSLYDFEALFIDDASTDDSAAIVEGIASSDTRFKLLKHSTNLGAGAARNNGIRAAKGETLCFADPDDLLPENSLELRYKAYKQHNAIVRACHVEHAGDGSILYHEFRPPRFPEICKPSEAAHQFGTNPFVCAHWTWLFPTRMLQRLGIYNEENMRTAEDITFLIHLFFHISRVTWIPDVVYHWVKRDESLSNRFYTVQHYLDYLRCVELFYEKAKGNKKIVLGDSLFNDYLSCYIPHVLKQAIQNKSTETDLRTVIARALDINSRYDVLGRYERPIRQSPMQYVGFFRLWHALQDPSSSFLERLVNGQNIISKFSQMAVDVRNG